MQPAVKQIARANTDRIQTAQQPARLHFAKCQLFSVVEEQQQGSLQRAQHQLHRLG
jgi:hypothetical protein